MSTIAAIIEKSNAYLGRISRDVRIVVVLLSAMILSFVLGYASGFSSGKETGAALQFEPEATSTGTLFVVASAGGTKYYYPWCAGADRIGIANKVWFATPEAAEAHGYERAANCDGL